MALEEKWVNGGNRLSPKLPPALTNAVTMKLLLWPGASRGRKGSHKSQVETTVGG